MNKTRLEVYRKHFGHCAYCGSRITMKEMQVDHIFSKLRSRISKKEVDNSIENLNPSCRACNYYKGGSGIDGFRKKIANDLSHTCIDSFVSKLGMKYGMIDYHKWDKKFYFEKEKNIILYFGSFNPIHNGHTSIANYVLDNFNASEIWFVISPQNPFKDKNTLMDNEFRKKLVSQVCNDKLKYCDVEFNMPTPSYTIDTLKKLEEDNKDVNFILLMGSDNLENFSKWKDYKTILDEHFILVYNREGTTIPEEFKDNEHIIFMNAPLLDISSTMIREKMKNGENIDEFVDPKVCEILKENFS